MVGMRGLPPLLLLLVLVVLEGLILAVCSLFHLCLADISWEAWALVFAAEAGPVIWAAIPRN